MNANIALTLQSLLNRCKVVFTSQKLSLNSRKLYLADIKNFLLYLERQYSSLTLGTLGNPSVYSSYLKLLTNKGSSPAAIRRSTAALKKFGEVFSLTSSLHNPALGLTLSNHSPKNSIENQPSPSYNYIKFFLNHLKSTHHTASTIKAYKSDLTQYLYWVARTMNSTHISTLLNKKNIEKYLIYLQNVSNIATSTLNRKYASLTGFQSWYNSSYPSKHSTYNNILTQNESLPPLLSTQKSLKQLPHLISVKKVKSPIPRVNFLVSLALILSLFSGLIYFGYRQLARDRVILTQAYPSTPVTPNRQLSFQGRLEDSGGTPITSSTNFVFKLWDDPSTGTQLYTTGTCAITPDSDGIFSTQIGSDCGSGIPSSVFTENSNVYLEVTVGAEILDPRQQIATVAYALNAETIQGIPISATMSAITNTVVPMNEWGEIIVGEQSPRLRAVSGTFSISAPSLSLVTNTGTNGNITIAPDGTGQVNVNGNTTTTNFFNVSNAQLTSGSLITGTVGNDNTGYKLLDLLSGSSPTSKFSVDDAGLTTVGADLYVSSGISLYNNAVSDDTVEANKFCTGDGETNCVADFSTLSSGASIWTDEGSYIRPTNGEVLGNSASAGSNKLAGLYLADSSPLVFGTDNDVTYSFSGTELGVTLGNNDINFDSNTLFIDGGANKVGIGNAAPDAKLQVTGAVTGKALAIFDETGDQDIIVASASGVTAFRVGNDGYAYSPRFADLNNNSYYLDPAATGISLNVAGDIYLESGLSTFGTAVSTGTIEATQFCTGDGETNCVTDFSALSSSANIWTDEGSYIRPTNGEVLGNSASAGSNKLAGLYLADSSPLVFGTDNDVTFSFSGTELGVTLGNNDINFDSNTLFIDGSANRVGIGFTGPDRKLDILDTTNPQLRLTYTDNSVFSDLQTNSIGNLTIDVSGTKTILADDLQINGNNIIDSTSTNRITLGSTTTLTNSTTTLSGTTTLTASSLAALTSASTFSWGGATSLIFTSDNALISGSDISNGNLSLQGTTNSTRTSSYLLLQPNGGPVAINASGAISGEQLTVTSNNFRTAWFHSPSQGAATSQFIISTAESQSTDFMLSILSGWNSSPDTEFLVRADGAAFADGGWNGAADFAEFFRTNDSSIQKGELLAIDNGSTKVVTRATRSNPWVIGAVSTNPGFIGTPGNNVDIDSERYANDPYWKIVGLLGQVPVLVSNENGSIQPGDPIAVSNIPGVGAKANTPGPIVGRALESYDSASPGKITVFIQPSWHDPNLSITNLGDLAFNGTTIEPQTIEAKSLISQVAMFTEGFIKNIKVRNVETNNLISPLATINTLETQTIKAPTPDQPVVLQGDLNITGEIDASSVSARIAFLQDVAANRIITDELVAKTITAESISGLDAKFTNLAITRVDNLSEEVINTISYRIKSRIDTLTGNVPTAEDLPTPAIPAPPVADFSYSLATGSANLASADIDFATINDYLAVIGSATITTLDITGKFYTNNINSYTNTLAILPLGGTINLANNTLIVDSIGEVAINGNLTVTGSILANNGSLGSLSIGNSQESTPSAGNSLLSLFNERGDQVSAIDASGSASFQGLSTRLVTIAAGSSASDSAAIDAEATTNATAGEANLEAPFTTITIDSPYVTQDSLIYLTPTGNTDNKVLFVKSKNTCDEKTNPYSGIVACRPSFTVAIDTPARSDISFNWWIIAINTNGTNP